MIILSSEYLYTLYEINNSPLNINILSLLPSLNMTDIYGDGLNYCEVSKRCYFNICPKDIYGNIWYIIYSNLYIIVIMIIIMLMMLLV